MTSQIAAGRSLLKGETPTAPGAPHVRDRMNVRRYMRRMLLGVAPVAGMAIYLGGWPAAALIAVSCASGWAAKALFSLILRRPITEEIWVIGVIYALTLPPTVPLWVAAAGIVFGIWVGQELFGGLGKNWFNPVVVGRLFLEMVFPQYLARPEMPMGDLFSFLWRNPSGWLGESSSVLLIAGTLWMIASRVSSWHIVLAVLLGGWGTVTVLEYYGMEPYPDPAPLTAVLSGGFLLGACLLATDPVTAPITKLARVLYGLLIGIFAILLKITWQIPNGILFAVFFLNPVAPILDAMVRFLFYRGKVARPA